MARRRKARSCRTKKSTIALVAVAGAIVGYLGFTYLNPVYATASVPCTPVPCTPSTSCTGIGGLTENIITGETITPTTDPTSGPNILMEKKENEEIGKNPANSWGHNCWGNLPLAISSSPYTVPSVVDLPEARQIQSVLRGE